MTASSTSFNHGGHDEDKSKKKVDQIKAVRVYLTKNVATSAMAASALNIRIPNVCRYKRTLEKAGQLIVLNKGICKLTRHRAEYLTCNPVLLSKGGAIV